MNRDETGKDGVLIVNGTEYVFTSVDRSVDWDETGSDYNDRMHTYHRPTAKDSSGTIEVEGSESELKSAIMNDQGEQRSDIRIQMTESEGGDRYTGVTITSFGKEIPGGDVTTTTIEWVANKHRPISS